MKQPEDGMNGPFTRALRIFGVGQPALFQFYSRITLAERSAKVMVRTVSPFCATGEKPSF